MREQYRPKKSSHSLVTSIKTTICQIKARPKESTRGERGSVEEDQQGSKRANMVDAKLQITSKVNNDEALSAGNEEETASKASAEETNHLELKEMLVDIQITVSNILRDNTKLTNEVAELRNAFLQQKGELTNIKTALAKSQKQQDDLEI